MSVSIWESGTLEAIALRRAKRAPMEEVLEIEICANRGLVGDFGRRLGRAQVSLLSAEKWSATCSELGANINWAARRANLLLSGVTLEAILGQRIQVGQAVVLEVTGSTEPCSRMDDAVLGLQEALRVGTRGGLRCLVVQGGAIKVGDAVTKHRAKLHSDL